AGDHVPRSSRRAADRVERALWCEYPLVVVPQPRRTGEVRPYKRALNEIARVQLKSRPELNNGEAVITANRGAVQDETNVGICSAATEDDLLRRKACRRTRVDRYRSLGNRRESA